MPIKQRSPRYGSLGGWQKIIIKRAPKGLNTRLPSRLQKEYSSAYAKKMKQVKATGEVFFDSKKPRIVSMVPERKKGGLTRTFQTKKGSYARWNIPWQTTAFRDKNYYSRLRAEGKSKRQFIQRIPHQLGSGAIIEICEKRKTTPSHIMLVQRSTKVFGGKGAIHVPAGFVEPNEPPQKTAIREIQKEILPNIKPENMKFVGPGFKIQKNQKNPLALTTVLDEARANPSLFYVIRVTASPEEVMKMHRKAEEGWEISKGKIFFVERTPTGIKSFMDSLEKNKRPTLDDSMPWHPATRNALRRYLTELMPDWRRKLK